MLLHNYRYRLKCILRDRQTMFWTLLFPIVLATLFNMAFANLFSEERFDPVKIGIVDNAEYRGNVGFAQAVRAVSSPKPAAGKPALFDVAYTSREEANRMLEDGKIAGYVDFANGMKMVVKKSGIGQTILKSFLDDYRQTVSTVAAIQKQNPAADPSKLIASAVNRKEYLKEAPVSHAVPNPVVVYLYSLIAMTCLYGSFLGLKEVTALQADLSPQGARVNMAAGRKLKLSAASMLAATTVQLFEIAVLLLFLSLVLKVGFGHQIGYIALTCIVASLTGVSYGSCLAVLVRKSEGLKIGLLVGLTMTMSMLSGMMYDKIKYLVSTHVPILGYVNPANLIADSLYALYYYDDHGQFYTDIALLAGFAALFIGITYLAVRRQRYASL